jgi:signal transduction histidine kinase
LRHGHGGDLAGEQSGVLGGVGAAVGFGGEGVLPGAGQVAVADVRRVIDDLRPADLDDGSLEVAVRRRAASIASVVDVEVEIEVLTDLRQEVEAAAYRIASEALTNVARHSCAHQAQVAVAAADGTLTVRVADDGTGIAQSATAGIGLESMRRRAQAVGGSLQIDSNQDGTVVTARLPL